MIKRTVFITALFAITLLSSCQVIGDIFKAGYYAGIFVVIVVIALIWWIFSYFRRR